MSTPDLHGKRAFVGGASRGIGQAIAEALADRGVSVTLLSRDQRRLEEVRDGLHGGEPGQTHRAVPVDYTDWRATAGIARREIVDHGPVHIVIHNTGGPPGGPAIDAEPEAFDDAFNMHLLTGQALVQSAVPGMRAEGYGRVINVISTSVITPIRGLGVSNTIRGAVANWGRTLAVELAPDGITVNNLLPGFTETDRLQSIFENKAKKQDTTPEAVAEATRASVPARRFAKPREIAAVAAFLCSPDAAYVNGVNLPVDGGRLVG
ncbi:MAG: SDR family oxidoreductase [Phycisphaerales bacterium]